jgi:hypothetical protein
MNTSEKDLERHLVRALDYITGDMRPSIEALGAVKARHVDRVQAIMKDRNIVGVGISEKLTAKKATKTLSICFYVEKKLPPSKVTPSRMVPPIIAMGDGPAFFTDVKAIGRIRPQINATRTKVESGYSVGHFQVTAGTLGAIVGRGAKLFALSNSHVLANSGKGSPGDPIRYPGNADGGTAADQLGSLSEFVPFDTSGAMTNLVDVALAEIQRDVTAKVDLDIEGAKSPLDVVQAVRGMTVIKRGRTTNVTRAKILDTNFRVRLAYPGIGTIGFRDQVLCQRYSGGGDSGSIVVDASSGKIVGLHFAGASGGSVFNPIQAVMKAIKFRFLNP